MFKNAGDELPDEILACMTGGKTREEIEAVLDNFFGKNSKDIKEKLGMAEPFATFDGISC